ncbi:MAG: condensation domain-containing protein, partial [Blastocatellia bacterium]
VPSFMAMSWFVLMDELPVNTNGKIDRKALVGLKPPGEAPDQHPGREALRQSPISFIWRELLHRERVEEHDNFFDLGGDSLLAVQLVSRVWTNLGVELEVQDVFEAPTAGSLTELIRLRSSAQIRKQAPPILALPRPEFIPLSFAQQRLWFLDQTAPGNAAYNIPVAVRLSGEVNEEALSQAFGEIARRYEILRTRIVTQNGKPSQEIIEGLKIDLSTADISGLLTSGKAPDAVQLSAEEAARPFSLQSAPLIRVRVLRPSPREHLLIFTMHHIVTDEWSTEILLRDMASLYRAYSQGQPSALTEVDIQYADFAIWQRAWLSERVLDSLMDYWRDQLAGIPHALELPIDLPRPAISKYDGATTTFELDKDILGGLKLICGAHGVTLFMLLLAAFEALLHRYSGQDDFVVGSPIANRNRSQIEPVVGFFSNTLALRARVQGDISFAELLARVRETALGAFERQDLPFEKLVDELKPERDLGRSPLFQVSFVFQSASRAPVHLPGLEFESVEIDTQTSKFELTLMLVETSLGIDGFLQYNTDLFLPATISKMVRHFRNLISGVIADSTT